MNDGVLYGRLALVSWTAESPQRLFQLWRRGQRRKLPAHDDDEFTQLIMHVTQMRFASSFAGPLPFDREDCAQDAVLHVRRKINRRGGLNLRSPCPKVLLKAINTTVMRFVLGELKRVRRRAYREVNASDLPTRASGGGRHDAVGDAEGWDINDARGALDTVHAHAAGVPPASLERLVAFLYEHEDLVADRVLGDVPTTTGREADAAQRALELLRDHLIHKGGGILPHDQLPQPTQSEVPRELHALVATRFSRLVVDYCRAAAAA